MNEPLHLSSSTVSNYTGSKYGDWLIDDVMEWVREASTDDDAVHNLKAIMKQYEKKKSFWTKFKALFL